MGLPPGAAFVERDVDAANVVAVAVDTYADLFDDDLDAVAITLHSQYSLEKCGQSAATGRPEGWVAIEKMSTELREQFNGCGGGGGI